MTLLKILHQEIVQSLFLTNNPVFNCNLQTQRCPFTEKKKECYFYKHCDNKNFKDEINLVDWEDFLQISKPNLNLSFELFNQKIESFLKTYYSKTIVPNTKSKETTKP